MDVEEIQRIDDGLYSSFNIPLIVRVLYTQIESAAALMGQSFIHKSPVEISKMNESRGTGTQPCDHSFRRKVALRIDRVVVRGVFGYIREKNIC